MLLVGVEAVRALHAAGAGGGVGRSAERRHQHRQLAAPLNEHQLGIVVTASNPFSARNNAAAKVNPAILQP